MPASLDPAALDALDRAMADQAASGAVVGVAWRVDVPDQVHVGTAGRLVLGGATVERDSRFRISSMTKPITAAAVLALVADGTLSLDASIDRWLPELAEGRVLRTPTAALADTVPADRPTTVADLLTSRAGFGMDFAAAGAQPALEAAAAAGLGGGPPQPQAPPPTDEWLRRLGRIPRSHQPGTRWLYHVPLDVAGALVARATGRPLAIALRDLVLDPLGMDRTGFCVAPTERRRLSATYVADPATGERTTFDPPDGQWAAPPPFPSGGAGLVSTVDDYATFAGMLRAGGTHGGRRLLPTELVAAMVHDHLDGDPAEVGGPSPTGDEGWGYGVGVQRRAAPGRPAGSYGWGGGLGSWWANDPASGLDAVLLTTEMWSSPRPPAVVDAFCAGVDRLIAAAT